MFNISYSIKIIRFSFLFWGLIASLYIGFEYVIIATIFYFFCINNNSCKTENNQKISQEIIILLLTLLIVVICLNISNLIYSLNNVLSSNLVNKTIDNANANVGKGRAIGELLANLLTLTPFIIIDLRKRIPSNLRIIFVIPLILQFIIMSGASRGMLSIIIFSVLIPTFKSWKKLILFFVLFLMFYYSISVYRDGLTNNYISNPILDSFLFPGYNLSLLSASNFHLPVTEYISQFFLKFIPSYFYDKNVFSFNIEMTKIIYPWMYQNVDSISVFTYMGDLIIYKPILITILFSLIVIRIISKYLLSLIFKYNLKVTSLYISLYFFIALRSRIFDLLSMLILYLLFLFLIDFLNKVFISLKND